MPQAEAVRARCHLLPGNGVGWAVGGRWDTKAVSIAKKKLEKENQNVQSVKFYTTFTVRRRTRQF